MRLLRSSSVQHENAADMAIKTSTQAVFLSSIFTAIAGVLSIWKPELAVIAVFGVIASAYSALVISRSTMNQDRKNTDRYVTVEFELREKKLNLDTYRKRIASGDNNAGQEFFDPIFVILEADHKAFLSEAEQRDFAIGDMEKRLDEARKAFEKEPVT